MQGVSIWELIILFVIVAIAGAVIYNFSRARHPRSRISNRDAPTLAQKKLPYRTDDIREIHLYERIHDELEKKRIKKGLWTKAFAEANGDMSKARAAYIRYRYLELRQHAASSLGTDKYPNRRPKEHSSPNADELPIESNQVRPWVRFWSRLFDLNLVGMPIGSLTGYLFPAFLSVPGSDIALSLVTACLWVLIETACLSTFGTTPGKTLFKITLEPTDTNAISLAAAFDRSAKVYFRGIGAGIPLVNLITLSYSYMTLMRNHRTSWDAEGQFIVTHHTIGPARILGAVAFFFAVVMLYIFGESF